MFTYPGTIQSQLFWCFTCFIIIFFSIRKTLVSSNKHIRKLRSSHISDLKNNINEISEKIKVLNETNDSMQRKLDNTIKHAKLKQIQNHKKQLEDMINDIKSSFLTEEKKLEQELKKQVSELISTLSSEINNITSKYLDKIN